MERLKAAARRQKQAEEEARLREALKAAGLLVEPEEPAGQAAAARSGQTPATRRKKKRKKARSGPAPVGVARVAELQVPAPPVPEPAPSTAAGDSEVQVGRGQDTAAADGPEDLPSLGTPKPSRRRKPITREDILKLAIADDLGYLDKVRKDGWGGLTTAESGRVGGMMTRRMKRLERGLPPV
ncbi:MAG: alpha/beta-type small acid-soluble spore protein [Firmicutes bacterium]|nr:alpha/beta-type small acid-soluble spore protein [Bacillota bacterium]